MRHLAIAAVTVLLTAGAALGAATATVTGPTVVMPGQVFEIQVVLTADEPMVGFMLNEITATGGLWPGPVVGTTTEERAAYHYANTAGWSTDWSTVPGDPLMGWASQTTFPVGPIGTVAADQFAGNGVCFRMNVVVPAAPLDYVFDICVTSGVYGGMDFVDVPLDAGWAHGLGLCIIPEPASALLLLAGLAMARRKRRA
ncbi:MAG: PEP-CTERM sorting domain-containing protein [Phycisphaerae bacterium]|nr:PEP-CTERM sorting domain-containing protein [Phycisphaerae bacterium]